VVVPSGRGESAFSDGADRLRQSREAVQAELAEARKAAPVFAERPAAVPGVPDDLRFALVAFSTRTSCRDVRLPELFQAIDTPGWNGRWGHGHDQTSGGHLLPDVVDAVLDALGSGPEAYVPG